MISEFYSNYDIDFDVESILNIMVCNTKFTRMCRDIGFVFNRSGLVMISPDDDPKWIKMKLSILKEYLCSS